MVWQGAGGSRHEKILTYMETGQILAKQVSLPKTFFLVRS